MFYSWIANGSEFKPLKRSFSDFVDLFQRVKSLEKQLDKKIELTNFIWRKIWSSKNKYILQ